MRPWAPLATVLLLLLAGCADGGGGKKPAPVDPTDDLDLQSTATTGVLRGVVVDEAVRPIPGVAIALSGLKTATTTTTANGAFGFDGLEPGTYLVAAAKPGFVDVQQTTDVVAGVDEPPLVRFQLTADPSTKPFYESYVFEGFIECSISFVAAGFAACSSLPTGNDKFAVTYTLTKPPQWLQSEMVWDSTQPISDALNMVYSANGPDALLANWAEAQGSSPLTIQTPAELNALWNIGNGTDLFIRVFNEPIDGTAPSPCVPRPVLGGCLTGLGATIQQKFTIYTHAFFGYAPDPTWRFVQASSVPPPPA